MSQTVLAVWIGLAVALIVWPFSLGSFSSQVAGVLMLMPCLITTRVWRGAARSTTWAAWAPLLLLAIILTLHWLAGQLAGAPAGTGLVLFLVYMVKIPLLYLLARAVLRALGQAGFAPVAAQRIVWLAVLMPLAIVAAQLLLPEFHAWSVTQLGGFRAAQVLSKDAQGHPFRFLGPNGFLFASHGVAFACTALGLLCFRVRGLRASVAQATLAGCRHAVPTPVEAPRHGPAALLTAVEGACLLMAVLSARSALPLVALYLVVRVAVAGGWRRRLNVALAYGLLLVMLAGVATLSPGGRQLLSWLSEPVRTSLAEGRLASHSVDATLDTYEDVAPLGAAPDQASNHFVNNDWLGQGLYFRDNRHYDRFDLIGSDSGFVRVIYVAGYAGLALFLLFWAGLAARAACAGSGVGNGFRNGVGNGVGSCVGSGVGRSRGSGLRVTEAARRLWRGTLRMREASPRFEDARPVRWFLCVFLGYGLLFFFKSEWLYQNFFVFQFFCLFHYLHEQRAS